MLRIASRLPAFYFAIAQTFTKLETAIGQLILRISGMRNVDTLLTVSRYRIVHPVINDSIQVIVPLLNTICFPDIPRRIVHI